MDAGHKYNSKYNFSISKSNNESKIKKTEKTQHEGTSEEKKEKHEGIEGKNSTEKKGEEKLIMEEKRNNLSKEQNSKRKGKGRKKEENQNKENLSRFFIDKTRNKANIKKRKNELREKAFSPRKKKMEEQECKLFFRIMNVGGLNEKKLTLIKNAFLGEEKVHNIICMTETQNRYEKVDVSNLISYTKMRKKNKRKGGGLQIIMRDCKGVDFEEEKQKNEEILVIEGKCFGMEMKVILVYFDVRKNEEGRKNNKKIKTDIETIIKNNKKECLMIIGDFNGHLEELDGRKDDVNGKMVMEWINEFDLMLMNGDEKCEGTITREQGEQKTAIDMVMMNRTLYDKTKGMKIDEEKDVIHISDHNLISIELKARQKCGNGFSKKKWREEECYRKDESALKEFGDEIEKEWKSNGVVSVEEMTISMLEVADRTLKKIIRRRISDEGEWERIESVWMNDEIREGINERRRINRLMRNCTDPVEKDSLAKQYQAQKEKVQIMIREAMERYEIELTKEILEDRGNETLWRNIGKLTGKKTKRGREEKIYQDGKLMELEKALDDFFKFWRLIYNLNENKIEEVWEADTLERLIEEFKTEENENENISANMPAKDRIIPMKATELKDGELKEKIRKLKNNKAAGTDKLKAELFKELGKRETCREIILKCFNNVLKEGETPESWNISRTKMIRKERRPTVRDFRPIAITNISYKIFMSLIRERIEEHLKLNNLIKDNQIGFTGGGRIEYNHMILQYIVEKTKKEDENRQIILTALDFKKAFDSVKRKELVETLKEYKIDLKIIDIVAKIYTNDETIIKMGEREETIKIGSGIKQGCTASTVFFKLITYEIMKELEEKGEEFNIGGINLNSIFYADDSITIASTIEDTKKNLEIIKTISKKFGLIVNENKSKIMIFKKRGNGKIGENKKMEEIKEIEGIEVVKSMRYLGVEINDTDDIFKIQKINIQEKAETIAKNTYSVIEKCCNKVLIGKTFWKGVALPSILMGNQVANFNKTQINELQTTENGVYRKILGGVPGTVLETVRGDIGASLMESRIMENKILFLKSIQEGENNLMKVIIKKMREDEDNAKRVNKEKERKREENERKRKEKESREGRKENEEKKKKRNIKKVKGNRWMETIDKYLGVLHMNYEDIERKDIKEIKRIVKEYDNNRWKESLGGKSSVKIYYSRKKEIKQEKIYDNRWSSVLLFRARANVLSLNDRQRFNKERIDGDTSCRLCKEGYEDLEHFLINCKKLEEERNPRIMNKTKGNNDENTVGNILFDIEDKDLEDTKKMLAKMWNKRKKLEQQENKKEALLASGTIKTCSPLTSGRI